MTDAPGTVNSIVIVRGLGENEAMRPVFRVCIVVAALSACAPLSIYYKPGVSVSRLNTDRTECEVAALRDAPVSNQIRQNPPVYVPGDLVCDAAGNCLRRAGYWVSGGLYTVDVNADLRGRVKDICMAQRGYQPVSIPLCSDSVKRAAAPRATVQLPELSEASCAIRYDDGSWQIVNPVSAK